MASLDSTDIPAGETLTTDLLIIGAGAAGLTLAKELAGAPMDVILLEAGGAHYDPAVQDIYRGTVAGQATEPLDATRLRFFGGTTNHWAGWCRPLEREDFEARPGWPASGWPIGLDALAPYYGRAAQTCELGPARFDDLEFWRAQPGGEAAAALAFDPGRLRSSVIQISRPTRFGEAYGDEVRGAANIRVIANAALRELVPAAETRPETARKRIAGAEIQSNAGHRFSIHARRIALAAGGLENARLLLLSQKVHPAGAGNERGLVGRYFMDHIWIPHAAYLQFAQEGVDLPFYFDELEAAGARLFSVLTPNADYARREGLGGFRLWLRPSRRATPGADALREIAADFGDRRFPDDFGRHLGAMLTDFGSVADVAYKTLFGKKTSPFVDNDPDAPIRGAYVDLNLEQRPTPESRITLDDARDGFGQRRIRLDWRLSDDDWRTALGACRLIAEEAGRIGLGRVRIALDGGGPSWPDETTGSRHHMGTTRMSDDPREGVVDRNLRVHTTENLYIASSSVFPTSGYANPTLTIVALAHRLADHLKAAAP